MFNFDLKANGTSVRTEVLAGITTFLSMVYILAVYPNIMGCIGIPAGGAVIAAALASFIGTFLMEQVLTKDNLVEKIPLAVVLQGAGTRCQHIPP